MSTDLDRLLAAVAHLPAIALEELRSSGTEVGKYRLERRLGAGGMGVVYQAFDRQLLRRVALKILPASTTSDAAQRARLLQEAQAAAKVDHPHVAAIYDVGDGQDGPAFIAMELVEGQSLRSWIDRGSRRWSEVAPIARQLASGLARAHALGVVHRDLKPENVRVRADGAIKILDFGLSCEHLPGAGTPGYMAPEQARGEVTDARSDVYAFGVMLEEATRGRKAPRAVRALIATCLAEDPAARFADGAALLARLEAIRPSSNLGKAGFALVAGALAAVIFLGWPQERPAAPLLAEITYNAAEAPVANGAISPDGARVAFLDRRGAFIQRLDQPAITALLTDPPLIAEDLSWFPDGKKLLMLVPDRNVARHWGMWTVEVPSGRAAPIGPAIGAMTPAVSPNGESIVYLDGDQLWLLEADHPEIKRLLVDADPDWHFYLEAPSWSPDGGAVLFARYRAGAAGEGFSLRLETTTLDGKSEVLVDDPRLIQSMGRAGYAWSTHGIAYALAPLAAPETPGSIWLRPIGEHAPREVYAAPAFVGGGMRSSRDGRISLLRFQSQADIYLADILQDGLQTPERFTLSDRNEWLSGWSSNGDEILLVSNVEGGHAVFAQSLTGGVPRLISLPGRSTTWPTAAKDGELLFWEIEGKVMHLRLRAADRSIEILSAEQEQAMDRSDPAPDGWWVRCAKHEARCIVSHIDGTALVFEALLLPQGTRRPLGRIEGLHRPGWSRWAVSPDGALIALSHLDRHEIGIYDLSLDLVQAMPGGPEPCQYQALDWIDAGSLLSTAICDGADRSRVYRFERSGTVPRMLWATDRGWIDSIAVSPDASRVSLGIVGYASNLWSLDFAAR